MRTFFVVNPAAGRGRARRIWEQIRPRLTELGEWGFAHTQRPGHATELARMAATQGYVRVVALGGDGTLSEVVNGLAGTGAALAVVPAGTANDFIRSAGIPARPFAAAELAMTGPVRPVDLGEIRSGDRSRYFINVAGFGFDAEVARAVNAYPKFFGGTVPYVLGILTTLWRYRPVPVELEVDGRPLHRKVFLGAVAIGQSYGGGMLIAPEAADDDGLFDVCLAGDVGPLQVLRLVPKIYSGGHRAHPQVEFFRCRRLSVRCRAPVSCQADGELAGPLPATFLIHPGGMPCVTGRLESAESPSPRP